MKRIDESDDRCLAVEGERCRNLRISDCSCRYRGKHTHPPTLESADRAIAWRSREREGFSEKEIDLKARAAHYVANRAHHSDVGGAQPASMGLSEDIYQEGLRIPPVNLVRKGVVQRDVLAMLLAR